MKLIKSALRSKSYDLICQLELAFRGDRDRGIGHPG